MSLGLAAFARQMLVQGFSDACRDFGHDDVVGVYISPVDKFEFYPRAKLNLKWEAFSSEPLEKLGLGRFHFIVYTEKYTMRGIFDVEKELASDAKNKKAASSPDAGHDDGKTK